MFGHFILTYIGSALNFSYWLVAHWSWPLGSSVPWHSTEVKYSTESRYRSDASLATSTGVSLDFEWAASQSTSWWWESEQFHIHVGTYRSYLISPEMMEWDTIHCMFLDLGLFKFWNSVETREGLFLTCKTAPLLIPQPMAHCYFSQVSQNRIHCFFPV